ncbi:MAG: hypothetical protein RSC06_10690, partial [Clostridia bacterium]
MFRFAADYLCQSCMWRQMRSSQFKRKIFKSRHGIMVSFVSPDSSGRATGKLYHMDLSEASAQAGSVASRRPVLSQVAEFA